MNNSKGQNPGVDPNTDASKQRLAQCLGFSELAGQSDCIRRLKAFGDLYASKSSLPEHILLIGAGGMGKVTIARAFAKQYNIGLYEHAAREFKRIGDLSAVITAVDQNEALVISDIQELPKNMVDILRLALQEFRINLIIGTEPGARVHPYQLNRFTLIATTRQASEVPPDLLNCFSLRLALQPYSIEELGTIADWLAKANGLHFMKGVAQLVASVAEGNPGTVEHLIHRLSRLEKTWTTVADATEALSVFGLNPHSVASVGTAMNADDIEKLTGVEFERLITALLQRMGFTAEMTRTTGDGGIDIIAHLEKPFVGGRYLIQCKRFAADALIGAPVVREFYGAFVADRKAIKGIFVTTSAFTAQACEFAQNLPLELIDGGRLQRLLKEHSTETKH